MLHLLHGGMVAIGALVVTVLLLPARSDRTASDPRHAADAGTLVQRAWDRATGRAGPPERGSS